VVTSAHTARTELGPVTTDPEVFGLLERAIAEAGDRVLDLHIKDLRDLRDKESQCVVGHGAMPVAGIFRQLVKMGYGGYVNLEYEIDAKDPSSGMKESFAHMRGVPAGMSKA